MIVLRSSKQLVSFRSLSFLYQDSFLWKKSESVFFCERFGESRLLVDGDLVGLKVGWIEGGSET